MKKIFWLSGEPSGDLHASYVLKELSDKNIYHFGIGGKLMQNEGLNPILPFENFSVMGFIEVLKHLPFFLNAEKKIIQAIIETKPDLVILIDYPGLNMRVAEKAKKMGFKVLYYIAPQFWAWKKKRLIKLKRFTDHICHILLFEEQYFKAKQINSTYVGHPIAEEIEVQFSREEFADKYSLDLNKKWIGFLPGSRKTEIGKILPIFLRSASLMDDNKFEFIFSQADSADISFFVYPEFTKANFHLIKGNNYEIMKHCDFLSVTSGTATIETAFLGTPFIIVYKVNPLSYEIGKRIIKIKRIGLPNIILDDDILPEFIQKDVNPHNISKTILHFFNYHDEDFKNKNKLTLLASIIGNKIASQETAKINRQFIQ